MYERWAKNVFCVILLAVRAGPDYDPLAEFLRREMKQQGLSGTRVKGLWQNVPYIGLFQVDFPFRCVTLKSQLYEFREIASSNLSAGCVAQWLLCRSLLRCWLRR